MKKAIVLILITLAASAWADTDVTIHRPESRINAGFKERVYIDNRQVLELKNGESATIRVSSGDHVIHAVLYTLTTPKVSFSVGSQPVALSVNAYSMTNFVVEQGGAVLAQAPAATRAAPAPSPPARVREVSSTPERNSGPGQNTSTADSVEGSLERAADTIMAKLSPNSKLAIVYVTSNDPEVTEFIANELEFIMVGKGFLLVDRSQLDRIRREQNFQMSGEVDDGEAVSIGKMAGANIILTGAVTGTGNLRRLRLRALDTQSAQVLVAASERF
jgi:hypothetical protein